MQGAAFIGVGNMGGGMARNLARAGVDLRVYDLDPAKAAAVGARACDSIEVAVAGAGIVLTMLPAGEQVAEVYRAHVFPAAAPGALLIDCSTIDIETARAVAEEAAARGFAMLDAPVSGGVGGAEAGTLAFMIGGAAEAVSRAAPLFEIMGAKVVHCGASGAGQAAKLCNNLMLAI